MLLILITELLRAPLNSTPHHSVPVCSHVTCLCSHGLPQQQMLLCGGPEEGLPLFMPLSIKDTMDVPHPTQPPHPFLRNAGTAMAAMCTRPELGASSRWPRSQAGRKKEEHRTIQQDRAPWPT